MSETMQQENLWHDTIYDALRDLITALGGPKKVGYMLRPSIPVSDSQRWLLHCLDPERNEKLSPDDVLFLMAEGRKAGCHVLAQFYAQHCFYEFTVTNPKSREQALQEAFIESVRHQEGLVRQLQELKRIDLKD